MVLSFVLGQRYYPIPYDTKNIVTVLILAFGLGYLAHRFAMDNFVPQTAFFLAFLAATAYIERNAIKALMNRLRTRNS